MSDFLITSASATRPERYPQPERHQDQKVMAQVAPYPHVLVDLVRNRLSLRQPGWSVIIEDLDRGQGSEGLTVTFVALVPDSRREDGRPTRVAHLFPVPPAAFNERSWRHWLFDRYCEVLRHEAAEMFEVDGRLPFAPLHAPGNDPYMVIEATEEEEHTDNRGRVNVRQTIRTGTGAIIGTRDVPTTWAEIANGTWHQHSMPDGSIVINHSEKPPPGAVHSAPIDAEVLRRFSDPESLGKRPKGWGE